MRSGVHHGQVASRSQGQSEFLHNKLHVMLLMQVICIEFDCAAVLDYNKLLIKSTLAIIIPHCKKSILFSSSRLKHDAVKQSRALKSPYNYQQIITLPLKLKGCVSFFKALRFQIAFKRSNQIVEASEKQHFLQTRLPLMVEHRVTHWLIKALKRVILQKPAPRINMEKNISMLKSTSLIVNMLW